jgi:hypothetical protein
LLVPFALDVLGVAAGFALGTWAGFAIGARFESRRSRLWWLAVPALAVVWAVDVAGTLLGLHELSLASLGLMAGLLTGAKYGAFPEVRLWERRTRD